MAIKEEWKIDGITVPVLIIPEWRKSNRISINKEKVLLRVPKLLAGELSNTNRLWAKEWLKDKLSKHPELQERFVHKVFKSGYVFTANSKSYTLTINLTDNQSAKGRIVDQEMVLAVPRILNEREKSSAIQSLAMRLIGKDHKMSVSERIHALNEKYIGGEINQIRLKNNSSNWGSCSSKKNINISIRILFAPRDVQDYIFIHELAHLKEMNHSSKYWSVVKTAMPDYLEKEAWLKANGHLCTL